MKLAEFEHYGGAHIRRLRKIAERRDVPADVRDTVTRAAMFLNLRLTDAAKSGCDEGERGAPCHWCGLKVNRRLG